MNIRSHLSGVFLFIGLLLITVLVRAVYGEWLWVQDNASLFANLSTFFSNPLISLSFFGTLLCLGIAFVLRRKQQETLIQTIPFAQKVSQYILGFVGMSIVVGVTYVILTKIPTLQDAQLFIQAAIVIAIYFILSRLYTRMHPYIVRGAFGFIVTSLFLGCLLVTQLLFFGLIGPLGPGDFGAYRIPEDEEGQAADYLSAMSVATFSLALWYDEHGVYPETILEMEATGMNFHTGVYTDFLYARTAPDNYHLAATIDNQNSYFLTRDADVDSGEIFGNDTSGCQGEPGKSCLDFTAESDIPRPSEHPDAIK